MLIHIEINEEDLKKLILKEIENNCDYTLSIKDIEIEVKSKQNFKSEWENANFRATIKKYI